MKRVLIIGNGGAGKTDLARKLQAVTGLPIIHLDRHYYGANWSTPDRADWETTVARLAARDRWIMDGNYAGSLEIRLQRADTVVFLDRPTWLCVWRVLRRTLVDYGMTRRDMAAGCRERFDWNFILYVATFNRDRRPRILARLFRSVHPEHIVVLCRDSEVDRYLGSLRPPRATT